MSLLPKIFSRVYIDCVQSFKLLSSKAQFFQILHLSALLIVEELFYRQSVLIDLQFSSSACKYTQNGVLERDCDACFEASLTDLSCYVALTEKRRISDSRTVIWCLDRLYTLYTGQLLSYGCAKKERKRRKQRKIEIFTFNFQTVRRINGTLGVYYTLEQLRVFINRCFASLCCVFLGAAPIPEVQP